MNYDLGRTSTDAVWNISRALIDLNKLEEMWRQSSGERNINRIVEQQQIILSYLSNIQEIDRKYHHYENFVATEIANAIQIISSWQQETFRRNVLTEDIKRTQKNLEAFYLQTGTAIFSSDSVYRNSIMAGSFIVFLISSFVLVKHIRTTDNTLVSLGKSQNMLIQSRQSAMDALKKLEESRGLLIETRQTALTKIASNVFHEFSNCIWLTALLAEEALIKKSNEEKNTAICKIQSHLQKTREMLGNLRTYIRGEKLSIRLIDLGNSISDLKPLLETIVGPEVELELRVTSDCLINIVPDHVRQIITNLAKNAVEAMPSGGKLQITVKPSLESIEHLNSDNNWIELCVSDTGIGMSEKIMNSAFTPFFSINKAEGTGMGLTGVENWVNSAGGTIQIKSTVGKGSIFIIYFPYASTEKQKFIADPRTQLRLSKKPTTILLIDDEKQALELQAASLRRENFQVFTASDPCTVEIKNIELADLLISDIRMPQKDGIFLAKELQKVKTLPVIFLTGDDLVPEMQKTIEQSFPKAHIAFKPISTSHLIDLIETTMAAQAEK